jgi:hypothetical protein
VVVLALFLGLAFIVSHWLHWAGIAAGMLTIGGTALTLIELVHAARLRRIAYWGTRVLGVKAVELLVFVAATTVIFKLLVATQAA